MRLLFCIFLLNYNLSFAQVEQRVPVNNFKERRIPDGNKALFIKSDSVNNLNEEGVQLYKQTINKEPNDKEKNNSPDKIEKQENVKTTGKIESENLNPYNLHNINEFDLEKSNADLFEKIIDKQKMPEYQKNKTAIAIKKRQIKKTQNATDNIKNNNILQISEKKANNEDIVPEKNDRIDIVNTDSNHSEYYKQEEVDKMQPLDIQDILEKIASTHNKKPNSQAVKQLISELSRTLNHQAPMEIKKNRYYYLEDNNILKEIKSSIKSKVALADNARTVKIKPLSLPGLMEEYSKKSYDSNSKNVNKEIKDYNRHLKEYDIQNINEKDNMTKKQLNAMLIDVPIPEKKSKDNFSKQILPSNIAKKVYSQPNKHLIPVTFDYELAHQAFDCIKNEKDSADIIKSIVTKLNNPDFQDEEGNTLLMHAVNKKDLKLTSILLSCGANPNIKNNSGFSPLHLAASYDEYDLLYPLIFAGGDPNLPDDNKNTPFMYVSSVGKIKSVKLLSEAGGNLLLKNKDNIDAIQFAKFNSDKEILDYYITKSYNNKSTNKSIQSDAIDILE
jgi:hypothetical protein